MTVRDKIKSDDVAMDRNIACFFYALVSGAFGEEEANFEEQITKLIPVVHNWLEKEYPE